MKKYKRYFMTSESVTEGHPDKVCDFISDSILDACLEQDKNSRVAVETLVSKNQVVVAGQITSNATIDIEKIVREKLKEVDYTDENINMDYRTCKIDINITKQSNDIALGVDDGGAGDQGIMFGYATDESEDYMPYPISIAHKLAMKLTEVIKTTIPDDMMDAETKFYINPTGRFVIGGALADTGLTGRKIIVDTYGGIARHGGGAFSGKDGTKVDRSGTYMLRRIAKNVVVNGLARKCEIQMSYGIGVKEPLSIYIDCFGTNRIPEGAIIKLIKERFDLTPNGIIDYLKLKEPIYSKTSNYGHFGRDGFTWEEIKQI